MLTKRMLRQESGVIFNEAIPDEYEHMHPQLIDAFEQQYEVLGMK